MRTQSETGLRDQRGVLLVELLVAMAVSAFFLGSLLQGFTSLQGCVSRWDRSMRMRQTIMAALFHVSRDLRMAGCDPWEAGLSEGVEAGGAAGLPGRAVTLGMDKRGGEPDSWPDGDGEDPDERVEYRWDASDHVLRRNGQPVLLSVFSDPWGNPIFTIQEKKGVVMIGVSLRVEEQNEARSFSTRVCTRNPL